MVPDSITALLPRKKIAGALMNRAAVVTTAVLLSPLSEARLTSGTSLPFQATARSIVIASDSRLPNMPALVAVVTVP